MSLLLALRNGSFRLGEKNSGDKIQLTTPNPGE